MSAARNSWRHANEVAARNAATLMHRVVLTNEAGDMTMTVDIKQAPQDSPHFTLVKKLYGRLQSRRPALIRIGGRVLIGEFIVASINSTVVEADDETAQPARQD